MNAVANLGHRRFVQGLAGLGAGTAFGLEMAQAAGSTGPAIPSSLSGNRFNLRVDVVALSPAIPSPHIELLGYRHPRPRVAPTPHPGDRLAIRLVFARTRPPIEPQAGARLEGVDLTLLHHPDEHAVRLDQRL